MKKLLKFVLGAVLVLVLLAVLFLTFFASPVASYVVNRQLPELLEADASVGKIKVGFWSGRVQMSDVRIGQPDGFEGDDLFLLEGLSLKVSPFSLLGSTFRIREVRLDSPTAHLIRDPDGRLNTEALLPIPDEEFEEVEAVDALPEEPRMAVLLELLELNNLGFTFTDLSDPGVSNTIRLNELNLRLHDLHAYPAQIRQAGTLAVDVGKVELTDAGFFFEKMARSDAVEVGEEVAEAMEPMEAGEEPAVALEDLGEIESEDLPPFRVRELVVANLSVVYRDGSLNPEVPYELSLRDIRVELSNLQAASMPEIDDEKGLYALSFSVFGPEGILPARVATEGYLAPLKTGIPTKTGFLRVTAFDLLSVEPFLVPGIETALGGSVFDLRGDWNISPEVLDVELELRSNNDVNTRVRVSGTPENPSISGSDIMLSVLARPGQMFTNLAGDTLAIGTGIVTGVSDTALDLAADAGRTVERVGSGVLGAGRSLLRGDVRGAGEGLVGTAADTAEAAAEGVARAGAGVGEAATGATDQALTRSTDRRERFLEEAEERHQTRLDEARAWLTEQPFPPSS